jgi:hypothetical protein
LPSTLSGLGPEATPYNEGYKSGLILGAALVEVLVVWLVLYFAFVRKHDPARGIVHFLIMLGVVFVVDMGVVYWALSLPPEEAGNPAAAQATAR